MGLHLWGRSQMLFYIQVKKFTYLNKSFCQVYKAPDRLHKLYRT